MKVRFKDGDAEDRQSPRDRAGDPRPSFAEARAEADHRMIIRELDRARAVVAQNARGNVNAERPGGEGWANPGGEGWWNPGCGMRESCFSRR